MIVSFNTLTGLLHDPCMAHQWSVLVCNATNATDLHFFIVTTFGFVYTATASNFICSCSAVYAQHGKFASNVSQCRTIQHMVLSIATDTFYGWALDTDVVQLFVRRQGVVPGVKRSILRICFTLRNQLHKRKSCTMPQCITREDGRTDDGRLRDDSSSAVQQHKAELKNDQVTIISFYSCKCLKVCTVTVTITGSLLYLVSLFAGCYHSDLTILLLYSIFTNDLCHGHQGAPSLNQGLSRTIYYHMIVIQSQF